MRYRLLALGAALAAGVSTSQASAQISASSMLSGRQARDVKVNATASVDYDSNVSKESASQAALQGLSLDDTIYSPAVAIDAVVPVGRQAVFLSGRASYLFHEKNRRLDHDLYDVTAGVGGVLGPCGTVVSGQFSSGRTQLADVRLVNNVDDVLTTVGATVGVKCARASGLGVVADAHYQDATNSASQLTNSDFNSTSAEAGISYGRPSLGTLMIQGTYSKTEYPNRINAFESTGYEASGANVSYQRQLGGKIQLSGTVGYSSVTPRGLTAVPPGGGPAIGRFRGTVYAADGSYRASSRLSAHASFSRQISPTLVAGRSFEVQTSYNAGLDYKVGSRITTRLSVQESDITAQGGVALDPAFALTNSKLLLFLAGLSYRQSQRLSLNFSAQHEQRRSENARFEYSGYRVGVSAGLNF